MTPEQREQKNQRDRERRVKLKAAGVKTLAEAGLAAPKSHPVNRKKELADINADLAKVFPGKPVRVNRSGKPMKPVKAQHERGTVAPAVKPRPFLPPQPKRVSPMVEGEAMCVVSFRGTLAHKEKLQRLGGAWIRKVIDKAPEPKA